MYPMINRENVDFSSDTEVCNIGYWEGVLADKRPCRVEEWVFHGVLNATVFISLEGLENLSLKGIKEMLLPDGTVSTENAGTFEITASGTYTFVGYDVAGNITIQSIKIDV